MRYLFIILSACFLLSGCNEDCVFVEHQELSPNLEWKSEDVITFEVLIEDNSIAYNQSIAFRYATAFPYNNLLINITETSPGGVVTQRDYEIDVIDENMDYIGDPGGDIWDLEQVIESNKKFNETGTYTYTIQHIMQNDPVQLAMEIGMVLDKVK